MADKGFGVKKINLIGASGTPTLTSPNNLNLNAVNVAISTDVSIGGTCTAYEFSGAIAGWRVGNDGTDHYTFQGPGFPTQVNDPELNLVKGQKYIFHNRSSGHPFRIQSTPNGSAGTAYNTGVTNNDGSAPTDIIFEVPQDAPDTLYYQCTAHSNMGGKINIIGVGATPVTGTTNIYNSYYGSQAGAGATSGASGNVAIGLSALGLAGGYHNAAVGYGALLYGGVDNVAIGYKTLSGITSTNNTAVGSYSGLGTDVSGVTTSSAYQNCFFGYASGYLNVGKNNTGLGAWSLYKTETNENVAVGNYSLGANTTGSTLTAVGYAAANKNLTASYNTALGYRALEQNEEAEYNTAVGNWALGLTTTTTAQFNTATGYTALYNNQGASNTAVGSNAGKQHRYGDKNTYVGNLAGSLRSGDLDTACDANTAIGYNALGIGTLGSNNAAVGYNALANYKSNAATAVGAYALDKLIDGPGNTGIGYNALGITTDSGGQTAVGHQVLGVCTSGAYNTGVGYRALYSVSTGDSNIAMGNQAGYAVTTSGYSVAIGQNALKALGTVDNGVETRGYHVALGSYALNSLTSDPRGTTGVGAYSLASATEGAFNSAFGYNSLGAIISGEDNNAVGWLQVPV